MIEPGCGETTDAILALDMDNGKVLWPVQDLAGDAWVVSCIKERNALENCPKDAGPDFDFGASPLVRFKIAYTRTKWRLSSRSIDDDPLIAIQVVPVRS